VLLRTRRLFLLTAGLTFWAVFFCAAAAEQKTSADLNAGVDAMSDTSHASQPTSMRLIFEYDGDEIRLVTQQPVDMPVTGFDIARTQRAGVFVDTKEASGRTLARVPARGALHDSVEVFPEKHGEPITRMNVDKPKGAFTVIVPVTPDADHVSVVQVQPSQPGTAARTLAEQPAQEREIARFPLRVSR
jgi:hypothetical protein